METCALVSGKKLAVRFRMEQRAHKNQAVFRSASIVPAKGVIQQLAKATEAYTAQIFTAIVLGL